MLLTLPLNKSWNYDTEHDLAGAMKSFSVLFRTTASIKLYTDLFTLISKTFMSLICL